MAGNSEYFSSFDILITAALNRDLVSVFELEEDEIKTL